MSLQIIRGKISSAVRCILSGTEGVGKTTLATQIPGALVIDTEDGSNQIDCARTLALDWRAIEHATKELIENPQGFGCVVYDSADWLERSLIDWMLKQAGKKSIEDYGYGKGYTILQEHFSRFLGLTDQLIAQGVHVVFVAHTKTVRVSPPDQTDGYDRYELKMTKQVSPLLKEWSDLYLFANYRIQMVEGTDGRVKAIGGKERVMYATRCAAWDAKNRFGLPDEMPMEFAPIARIFAGASPRTGASTTQSSSPPEPVASSFPALATKEQLARITAMRGTAEGIEAIEDALEKINAIDISELTVERAAELIASVKIASAPPVPNATPGHLPANYATWLDANADLVNAYLVRVKWLSAGQTWRDLSDERAHSIVEKAEKFARAAGIPAIGGKAA